MNLMLREKQILYIRENRPDILIRENAAIKTHLTVIPRNSSPRKLSLVLALVTECVILYLSNVHYLFIYFHRHALGLYTEY